LQPIGRIAEIWRYPVSSLGGEQMASAEVEAAGIVGDRLFALIDSADGLPAVPEKHARWHKALHLRASCVDGGSPTIAFPDGRGCSVDDPSLNQHLSNYFGFAAAIASHAPIEGPVDFPLAKHRHVHFPIHVLTTNSLKRLAELRQAETIDVRRFRPTVLIEISEGSGFLENGWIDKRLRLGATELRAREATKRCGITMIAQPGLGDDPDILRTIVRHNKRTLGVYCSVDSCGTIRVGDDVCVGDAPD
jgi:uncharacterized protein YcbX